MTEENDIKLTATGVKIPVNEKVSTGEYETAQVGSELEVEVQGADVTDGLSDELKGKIYAMQLTLQNITKEAADKRRERAFDEGRL